MTRAVQATARDPTAPRVSIVMPAYNVAATVDAAVRSVLLQTVSDLEVLVVDDGSTDSTCDRVASLARDDARVKLLRQQNGGPASARNRGLSHVRGELVTFLDADDLLLPTYIQQMTDALDAAPNAGLAFTDAWVLDDVTGRVRKASAMAYSRAPSPLPTDAGEILRVLLTRNFIFIAATARAAVVREVGMWRQSTPLAPGVQSILEPFAVRENAEDYDLWLRIVAAGHAVVQVAGRLAIYRDRPGSNIKDADRNLRCNTQIYDGISRQPGLDASLRDLAMQRKRHCERALVRRRVSRATGLDSVLDAVRRSHRRVQKDDRWLDTPPDDVERTLTAVDHP